MQKHLRHLLLFTAFFLQLSVSFSGQNVAQRAGLINATNLTNEFAELGQVQIILAQQQSYCAADDGLDNVDDALLLQRIDNLDDVQLQKLDDFYAKLHTPKGIGKSEISFSFSKTIDNQIVTIEYKNGFPNFENYSPGKDFIFESQFLNGSKKDMTAANKWAKQNFNGQPVVTMPNGQIEINGELYTWHHLEDGRRMIPVRTDVHFQFAHSGGHAIISRDLQDVFTVTNF